MTKLAQRLIISGMGLAVLFSGTAYAASIKSQIPDSMLAEYCSSQPVDSHSSASFTLPNGSQISGTIHCEAEDLIVGSDDRPDHDLNDDHGGDRDDMNDDGEHHGGDDDSGHHDDSDDSGHGGDDDGDDDSGHGSDDD